MEYVPCIDCAYCDLKRENEEGKARCTKYSQYVDANEKCCDGFLDKEAFYEKYLDLQDELTDIREKRDEVIKMLVRGE